MQHRTPWLLLAVAAPALLTAISPGDGIAGCVWGPVTEAAAVQKVPEKWATATDLPPLDQPPWDLSLDGDTARLLLRFAKGTLTIAWRLDDACAPTAILVEPSTDYEGPRPDTAAVKRLEQDIRPLAVEAYGESRASRVYALLVRILAGGVAMGLVAAGLSAAVAGMMSARVRTSLGTMFGWAVAVAWAASTRLGLVLLGLVLATALVEPAARLTHIDDRLLAASLFYV